VKEFIRAKGEHALRAIKCQVGVTKVSDLSAGSMAPINAGS